MAVTLWCTVSHNILWISRWPDLTFYGPRGLIIIYWLINMLLASNPDLWKRMAFKCSITKMSTYPLLSWCKIANPFSENSNVLVFPFLSTSSCRLITCGSSAFKDSIPFYSLKVSLISIRSSAFREDLWDFVGGESLSRNSSGVLSR